MRARHVRRLPIVIGERAAGIVTLDDLRRGKRSPSRWDRLHSKRARRAKQLACRRRDLTPLRLAVNELSGPVNAGTLVPDERAAPGNSRRVTLRQP